MDNSRDLALGIKQEPGEDGQTIPAMQIKQEVVETEDGSGDFEQMIVPQEVQRIKKEQPRLSAACTENINRAIEAVIDRGLRETEAEWEAAEAARNR